MQKFEQEMIEAIGGHMAVLKSVQDKGPVLMLGILAGIIVILLIISHFLIPYIEKGVTWLGRTLAWYVIYAFKWVRGDDMTQHFRR